MIKGCIDFIDGPIAGYLNQTSKFGEILDLVCDDISRLSLWICAIYYSQFYYYSTNINDNQLILTKFDSTYCYTILISGIYFSSMEWFFLVVSQIESIYTQTHWKSVKSRQFNGKSNSSTTSTSIPQIIVSKVFANGFRNRYGFIIVGSSLGLPWLLCAQFNGYDHFIVSLLILVCWIARIICNLIVWYLIANIIFNLNMNTTSKVIST